jgi:hypothetical protein
MAEGLLLPTHKFFFWLLIKDRPSTRNILRKKNMYLEYYNCVICNVFFTVQFHKAGLEHPKPGTPLHRNFPEMVEHFRSKATIPILHDSWILMCWTMWNSPSLKLCKSCPCF